MRTVKICTFYLNLHNKTNKCTRIKYVLSHLINYQHLSITLVITIRLALQQYQEYNKLPNCISGTTYYYHTCLRLSIGSQNISLIIIKNIKFSVKNKKLYVLLYLVKIHPVIKIKTKTT